MLYWFSVGIGRTKDRDVRRMLLGDNKRQTDVCELHESPSLVLVGNLAIEVVNVPIDRLFNIRNSNCNVVKIILLGSCLSFGHVRELAFWFEDLALIRSIRGTLPRLPTKSMRKHVLGQASRENLPCQ
jgi:hypothetical protein